MFYCGSDRFTQKVYTNKTTWLKFLDLHYNKRKHRCSRLQFYHLLFWKKHFLNCFSLTWNIYLN